MEVPISIVADDREPEAGVIAALRALPGVEVKLERLQLGDYRVDDRLLFERKTLIDLVSSIEDGRLLAQGLRLAASPVRSIILLEGSSRNIPDSAMRREAIQGALITLTVVFGIPLLRSLSPDESARVLIYTARQVRHAASGMVPRHGWRPKAKRRRQLHILQGLPGVGPKRAAWLLDKFGTVEAAITAPLEELLTLRGIGLKVAREIRWAVKEPSTQYVARIAEMNEAPAQ